MMKLTKPDQGWAWVVMVSTFIIQGLNCGILYGTGIIQMSLLERFHQSVALTSWSSGLYIFFMSSGGVIASWIINRHSCRMAFLVGSVTMSLGLVCTAFVESIELVFLTFGIIAGVGSGIIYSTSTVVIGLNFEQKRGIATGLSSCGSGAGAFLFSPLIQIMWNEYGNKGFFFIMAGMTLNICVFGSLCFRSYIEFHIKDSGILKSDLSNSLQSISQRTQFSEMIYVLKNMPFLCICVSLLFSHIGIYMVLVHLPNYSVHQGSSNFQASFLMSIVGLLTFISKLFIGFAGNADDIPDILLYFGTYGLLGLSTLSLPLYGMTYPGQCVYAVFLGLYGGGNYVLLNTITPKLVGIKYLASAFGIEMAFAGIGTLIGPPLAGIIIDSGGSYGTSFVLAGFSSILSAILGISTDVLQRLKVENDTELKDEGHQQCASPNSEQKENIPEQKSLLYETSNQL